MALTEFQRVFNSTVDADGESVATKSVKGDAVTCPKLGILVGAFCSFGRERGDRASVVRSNQVHSLTLVATRIGAFHPWVIENENADEDEDEHHL